MCALSTGVVGRYPQCFEFLHTDLCFDRRHTAVPLPSNIFGIQSWCVEVENKDIGPVFLTISLPLPESLSPPTGEPPHFFPSCVGFLYIEFWLLPVVTGGPSMSQALGFYMLIRLYRIWKTHFSLNNIWLLRLWSPQRFKKPVMIILLSLGISDLTILIFSEAILRWFWTVVHW